jgi:hypothetical protein
MLVPVPAGSKIVTVLRRIMSMGLRRWWREKRRRALVRFNARVLRRLGRLGGQRWMAAYVIVGPVLALVLFFVFLPLGIRSAMVMLHDGSWLQRTNGWLKLASFGVWFIANVITLRELWLKSLRDLNERPRRKKLRRDYDRQFLGSEKSR